MRNERWYGRAITVSVALTLALACAQPVAIPANRYGLQVVPDVTTYRALAARNHGKELVDVATAVPGIRIDVRYATPDNFMHEPLYPMARVFLRRPAAEALRAVQHDLAAQHLGLKVFDGYRPYRVTEKMWEPYKNPDYVADPAKGSRHNRGAAVDLTLVNLETGEEVAMPTPYDDFTKKAWQDYMELTPEVLRNRATLRDAMRAHGFEPLPSEWWHFDFQGWKDYELMDVDLRELP